MFSYPTIVKLIEYKKIGNKSLELYDKEINDEISGMEGLFKILGE